MRKILLMATLLGSAALAQTSVMNIPALPPGAAAPKPAATAPAAPTSTTSSVTTTTPAQTSAPAELPTVTTLPTAPEAIPGEYTVALTGPSTVRAGEANTWSFTLTNTGSTEIKLQHGACDVRFEVLNAAGEVVRPDPRNAICTMQLVYFDAQPGETQEVQKIRWEGKDGSGQPVPAGEYTIRARYVGGGQYSPAATFKVTVQ